MTLESKPVKIIPKEKAVFRLDKNGIWYNHHRKFAHRKIINYFHSAIKKDKDGYFLEQEHSHFIEKVYFPYEDTALFVFRILQGDRLTLRLNTGKHIRLNPEKLFIRNDHLYVEDDGDIIKFSQNALLSIAAHMDDADGHYTLHLNGRRYPIRMEEAAKPDPHTGRIEGRRKHPFRQDKKGMANSS